MTGSGVRKINRDEARNEACDPLISFDLDEVLHPDPVVHVLQSLIPHGAVVADESL